MKYHFSVPDTFPMTQSSRAARIMLDVLLTLFALIELGIAVAVLYSADLSRPDVWVFFALMVFCAVVMLLELLHLAWEEGDAEGQGWAGSPPPCFSKSGSWPSSRGLPGLRLGGCT